MDFLKIIAFLFGLLSVLGSLAIFFYPEKYKNFVINHVCKEKRPAWLVVMGFLIIALTVYCWYLLLQEFNLFALILCLYLTMGIIKSFFFLFQYEQLRKFVIAMLSEEKVVTRILSVFGLLIGSGLIWIGYLI